MPGDDDDDGPFGGVRFTLPPIRLPSLRLPEGFAPVLPIPRRVRGSGNALLGTLALDLLDAAVAIAFGGGAVRVGAGTLLAAVILGPVGLAYAWEAASLVGPAWLAVVPSATLLLLLRRRRGA